MLVDMASLSFCNIDIWVVNFLPPPHLFTYVLYVYDVLMHVQLHTRRGIRSHGTTVTDGCDLEIEFRTLEEQPVLSINLASTCLFFK